MSDRTGALPVRRPMLLDQAPTPRLVEARQTAFTAASRRVVLRAAAMMRRDRLSIDDGGSILEFGAEQEQAIDLKANVIIRDDRAWKALATEGSVGLGRGYIEGWWTSDDPTAVVRVLARNMGGIDDVRNRVAAIVHPITDRARRILPAPTPSQNRDDIAAHYDLSNRFFGLFLDETMTYSSAVFTSPFATLAEASVAKYDRLLQKIGLDGEQTLLEIGTGWGGLALRAATEFGATVTTTTISNEQFTEAGARIADAVSARAVDSGRITLERRDWRDLDTVHDRVVSVEMIEAVHWRDYPRFFSRIERCLAPDGMVGLQAICVPDSRYERAKNTEDFIRRFVFPGGFLPSIGAIGRAVAKATRLQLLDVEDLGAHYAETLRRWRIRFDNNIDSIRALGFDDRFVRLWRFYLSYCEAAFLERSCTVNQIVLVGPDWRPDGLRLRPF